MTEENSVYKLLFITPLLKKVTLVYQQPPFKIEILASPPSFLKI